jgi:Ca-activated chloride channel homolog
MMHFENKFLVIIPIIAAIFWTLNYFKIFKKPEIYLSQNLVKKGGGFKRGLIFIVGIISWGLISFSMMGPRLPQSYSEANIEVNDIFFVVDVSRSMLAEDFTPNRLEVAKDKIADFVKLRPTDRIGIIMFSERVFTLLPLTLDLDLVSNMIENIKVGFLGSGTNIGDAVGLAVGRAAQSIAKSKIIILLTDGVSNVGSMTPLQAAEEAKNNDIKVYTIGIGQAGTQKIPTGRKVFGRKQYQYIPGGSIDGKTLETMSDITKGKYFMASDEEALKSVLLEIEKLERSEIKVTGQVIFQELYYKYLLYGVVSLLLVELIRLKIMREVV